MANDTREDHGSYYPGAKVIVSGSGTSGTATDVSGKVDRVTIGEIGDTYTNKDIKEKINSLIRALAPVASCLAAMLCMSTAMAATKVFEDIPSNARVVVSEDDPIALAAIPEIVGAATNAAVQAAKTYADAAVAIEASNREDAVEGILVRSKSYTDTATNALAAKIPVVDLEPYATKKWVEGKGYVTSDALGGVATKNWISEQGYLTQLAMAPYATMDWVLGKGYATASVTNGLATKSELDALKRRYADTNGVTRLWSEDGLTMTDGTGVVWSVSWAAVTNWVSLTNGIVYRPTAPGVWIGDGVITNREGTVGVGRIEYGRGMPERLAFGLDGGGGFSYAEAEGLFLDYSDEVTMLPDAFTGIVERAALYVPMARVVTNAVGYVANGIDTNAVNDLITSATKGLATKADLAGHVPSRAETFGTDSLWTDATGVVWRAAFDPWRDYWTIEPKDVAEKYDVSVGLDGDFTWTIGVTSDVEGSLNGTRQYFRTGYGTNTYSFTINLAYTSTHPMITAVRHPGGKTEAVGRVAYTNDIPDVSGYATQEDVSTATNGLATAESVDGLAADVAGKADAAAVYAKDEADARFYPADEGALWASWWSGDGFRVAVSNYDVSASSASWDRLPSASFDYRPGGTGALVRVWSETTRWERHRAEAAAFSNAVDMALAGKAGLDWGRTTPTGFDAPEGFTWLDTPAVAVAGGLAWQRTVTSEGEVWLLCSNGMVADVGGATNGSFRVVDMATGEPAFEVVQGERRTVGANCGEVYTWKAEDGKTHMRVVYNVASDDPPVLHVADELKPQGGTVWHDEGAEGCPALFAGWTGSSGAWTNALWRASDPAAGARDALFCFATYETGGETVVKNRAPVSMSKIVVGGVTYAIGTATVGGHTVLTLTEAK